jgi:hypothetical protein
MPFPRNFERSDARDGVVGLCPAGLHSPPIGGIPRPAHRADIPRVGHFFSRSAPRRERRGMKSILKEERATAIIRRPTRYSVLLPDCWQNFGNCIVVWAPSHPGSTSLLADFPAFRILGFGKVWHTISAISSTQSRNAANGPRPTAHGPASSVMSSAYEKRRRHRFCRSCHLASAPADFFAHCMRHCNPLANPAVRLVPATTVLVFAKVGMRPQPGVVDRRFDFRLSSTRFVDDSLKGRLLANLAASNIGQQLILSGGQQPAAVPL